MLTESHIHIEAPPGLVWDVFSDVERWPAWTPSMTRLEALDGAVLAVGNRYLIDQPRMPRLTWTVTEVDPGTSWTWVQRSPGGVTSARHDVTPAGPTRTLVEQRIEQHGVGAVLMGALMRRMIRRYLDLEAKGLARVCEARWG